MKARTLFFILFALLSVNVFSQIGIRYSSAKKSYYHPGDTARITILMRLNPKSCLEGMKKTYIYYSGCEDILNGQWMKRPNYIFQKEVLLRISAKQNKARMTIVRETDKESLFRQETLTIK